MSGYKGCEQFRSMEEEKPIIEKQQSTQTRILLLALLACNSFCGGCNASLQAPFFPKEARLKKTSPTEYGFIFAMFHVGFILVAPVMGKLVGIVDPKKVLNCGIFAASVTTLLMGATDRIPGHLTFTTSCLLIRFFEGISISASRIAGFSIASATFNEGAATAVGTLQSAASIGHVIGPAIGGALYDLGGFSVPFFAVGIAFLLDGTAIYFFLPSSKSPSERKDNKKTTLTAKTFYLSNLTIMYGSIVVTTFGYIGFIIVTQEHHLHEFNLSGFTLGCIVAMPALGYALSGPVWGRALDKKCRSSTICFFGLALTLISLLFIGPMPFLHIKRKLVVIVMATTMVGLGTGAITVSSFSGLLKQAKNEDGTFDITATGMVSSFYTIITSFGSFLGTSTAGYFLDHLGFDNEVLVHVGTQTLCVLWLTLSNIPSLIKLIRKRSRCTFKKSESQIILEDARKGLKYGS